MEELDLTAGVSSVEVDVEGGHLLPSAGSASRRNFTASLSCMCEKRREYRNRRGSSFINRCGEAS